MLLARLPKAKREGRKEAQAVVQCDVSVSPKCKRTYLVNFGNYEITRQRNGKDICLFCSRKLKFSGRGNPNCQYTELDDNFFNAIDTEGKAYLLGWIVSDGWINPGQIGIGVHKKDQEI